METLSQTDALAAYAGRAAGSDAERRAAGHLRARLEALGRHAEVQPIDIRPRFALAHALHAIAAIAGSLLSVGNAPAGTALVLLAALSTFLDASGTLHLARRLMGRRASQNVESREDGGKSGVLVLVAHVDAPRDSLAFRRATRILRDPWLAMLAAMLVILACGVLRVLGVEGTVLTAIQFAPTVLLILLTPALVDAELSGVAVDTAGAAGAATALRLAEDLGGGLEHYDLWVLLTGSQEPFALGMGAWLKRRRGELDRERVAVLSIGGVGSGPVRFTRREGPLVPLRSHAELVRICGEIAEDDGDDGAYGAESYVSRRPTDAAAAIARGLPALTVTCAGDDVSADGLERAYGFCRELIERLDAEVGPTLRA